MSLRHTGVREQEGKFFNVKLLSYRKWDTPSSELFQKSGETTQISQLFLKVFDQAFNLCKFQLMFCRFYLGNRLSPLFHSARCSHPSLAVLLSLWCLLFKGNLLAHFSSVPDLLQCFHLPLSPGTELTKPRE